MNYKSTALILTGIVIGCGASLAHNATVSVASAAGQWRCYAVDRFPNVQRAMTWGGAEDTAEGMNHTAQHSPTGTVVTFSWGPSTPVLCVKY